MSVRCLKVCYPERSVVSTESCPTGGTTLTSSCGDNECCRCPTAALGRPHTCDGQFRFLDCVNKHHHGKISCAMAWPPLEVTTGYVPASDGKISCASDVSGVQIAVLCAAN